MMVVIGVTVDAVMGLLETKRQEDGNAMNDLSAADVVDQILARRQRDQQSDRQSCFFSLEKATKRYLSCFSFIVTTTQPTERHAKPLLLSREATKRSLSCFFSSCEGDNATDGKSLPLACHVRYC